MRLAQVAFAVADLEQALARYSAPLDAGTWRCYTFGTATHATAEYMGRPTDFSVRLALNDRSPQLELIEPLAGDSIYTDWLQERREGVHHLGYVVDSVVDATRRMEAAGHPVIQAGTGFGRDGDGAYAYFDTVDALGVIVEVFEPPARMPDAESVWPTPHGS